MKTRITPEEGIPIPSEERWDNRTLYPFTIMKVGESFNVEAAQLNSVRSLAHRYGKRLDRAFVVRPYKNAWRCWRVQ